MKKYDINKSMGNLSFANFKKWYASTGYPMDVEVAYKSVGGKVPAKVKIPKEKD